MSWKISRKSCFLFLFLTSDIYYFCSCNFVMLCLCFMVRINKYEYSSSGSQFWVLFLHWNLSATLNWIFIYYFLYTYVSPHIIPRSKWYDSFFIAQMWDNKKNGITSESDTLLIYSFSFGQSYHRYHMRVI